MQWIKPEDAQLIERLKKPTGKVKLVLDTDTFNEVDDQFAVAYALLKPDKFDILGIHAAPFFIDSIDGNRLITSCKCLYESMEKACVFNGFPVLACIFSYRRISWYCKVEHHFSTTNKTVNASTGRCYYAHNGNFIYGTIVTH